MEKRWIIVFDEYEGLKEKAIEIISGMVSGFVKYVLLAKRIDDILDDEIKEFNIIAVGQATTNRLLQLCQTGGYLTIPKQSEGYSIYVGENPLNSKTQIIAIAGYDDKGVLYGCVDFCNKYCGHIAYQRGDLFGENYFNEPFNVEMPSWKYSVSPAVKTRALWTWGHVIYDYKKFFENMLKLRLKEVVIWNDCVPLNAKKVVEYAHSLGIKVIWGFAWGWAVKCDEILNSMNEKSLQTLKENVLNTYQTQYADVGGDGIYFQSFTELNTDNVGGKCIAEIVTELVNDISGALFERYPDLHIQFGLHATSVKTHLDILQKVDNRICIVWEDCGAFPYDYSANKIENFDETVLLVKKLLTLRGETEAFGSVLKGMLKLDWELFEHFQDRTFSGNVRTDI